MDFFEVIKARRSVRKYTSQSVLPSIIHKALDAALLAPNSSNMQTWGFFWVNSGRKKEKLVEACLKQSAARTAQELVVVVADPSLWKHNRQLMLEHLEKTKALPILKKYYQKLIPMVYGYRWLAPLKWLFFNFRGLYRATPRGPLSLRGIQEVSIKSAALAAENFMLAITAQGLGSCPMEGFDEARVKRLLGLRRSARVVMVISVGYPDPAGVWGEQLRFDRELFIHEI